MSTYECDLQYRCFVWKLDGKLHRDGDLSALEDEPVPNGTSKTRTLEFELDKFIRVFSQEIEKINIKFTTN